MNRRSVLRASLGVIVTVGLSSSAFAQAADVIEASKAENRLSIYSNMGTENWNPIIRGFNEKYPWIQVETLNLGASEPIVRYRAETGSGIASADFIVTGSITDWMDFGADGLAADYVSAEDGALPDWSKPYPGVYTFSTDPMLLGYNTALLSEEQRPDSFAGFVETIVANPGLFKGRVGTYAGVDGFGGSINFAFLRDHGEQGWDWLTQIAPSVKAGDGSGAMIEKLTRGEYTAVYFLSGPVVMPQMETGLDQIMEWKYISDGTPVFLRGMAIPQAAVNINAAKLMLDYLLSVDGQLAISQAGFTPYRDDLPVDQLRFDSLATLSEKIGAEDIIRIEYDPEMKTGYADYAERWTRVMTQ